jgi:hypothetical protein
MKIFSLFVACMLWGFAVAFAEVSTSIFTRTNQPAPDFTSDARFSFFDIPFITPGGDVLFGADVVGIGLNAGNNTGIFFGKSAPELVAAAREQGLVPGFTGLRFFELSGRPLAAPGGRLVFAPGITGAGSTEANDGSIFAGSPNALQLVAREGQVAQGTGTNYAPNWIIAGGVRTAFDPTLRGSSGGRVGFRARLANSAANADTAFYTRTTGALPAVVAVEGAIAADLGGAVYTDLTGFIFADTLLNGAGVCLFRSFLSGPSVTTLNNEGLFRGPAGDVELLFRRGDSTPLGGDLRFVNFIPQGLNDAGDLLFTSLLQTSTGSVPADDACLWYLPQSATTPILLVREGDTLPGSPLEVLETTTAVINASGTIAVQVVLSTGNEGIWKMDSGGPFTPIARTGQECPGLPDGIFFQDFEAQSLQLDAAGHVAFRCTVGATPASAVPSIWVTDNTGQLQLVARVGDTILEGSTPRAIIDIAPLNTNPSGGEDGRNRVLSSAGKLVLLVQLSAPTFTQAILLADLSGPPNTAPTAADDEFTIRGATRLAVLENDMDADGDTLRVVSVTQPAEGRAAVGADFVSYTPGANFDGEDSFSYVVSDGRGGTATANVIVRNPFVAVRGTFTTSVSRGGTTVGSLTITLSSSGAVAGKLIVDGVSYKINGLAGFDLQFEVSLTGRSKPPLDLTLTFADSAAGATVSGTGSSGGDAFDVESGLVFSRSDLPQAPAGRYTFSLPGGAGAAPHGDGWLSVIVRSNGSLRAVGRLPDNVPVSFSTALRVDGTVPVFVRMYKKPAGSLSGEWTFDVPNSPSATGTLTLTKPAGAKPNALFPDGFTLNINTQGNSYTPPGRNDFALAFTNNEQPTADAQFSDGGLAGTLTQQVRFKRGDKAKATEPVTFPVKANIRRASGVVTGNFTPPGGERTKFTGVVLMDGTRAQGLFAGESQTGDMALVPD